jgi:apolipoprotein N-acyltransferase
MLVLGAAQTVGFVQTGWAGVPLLLALAVLVYRLNAARPGEAAWLGWCFGLGWLAAGVWWLYISMHRYGGLPAPLAAAAVLLLSAALAVYLALACAAYARWRGASPLRNAGLFAALWLLAELARGLLFTGFPWLASGYAFVDAPLAGLAPWIGVYGMGAVAAGLVAWVLSPTAAQRRFGHRRRPLAVAYRPLLALVIFWGAGVWGPVEFTRSTGTLKVSLLQTAVAQNEKFAFEQMPQTLLWLGKALVGAKGDLVVAPETALPLLPAQLEEFSPGYRAGLEEHFRSQGRHALVGLPLGDFDSGYTNSVAGLGGTQPYRYDKVHLVPFGEFIPTGFRWFTELMNIPLGDFARGPLDAPHFAVRGQRVAPNICFEDLFGEELAVRFRDEAQAPTILANISNIGWFDDSSALPQHLNISRMRALELQRPMLRSTNTGVTAIVDHRGQVTAQLPPLQQGVLEGVVEGRTGNTPYARWAGHYGLWPVAAAALALVLLLALWRRGHEADSGLLGHY